MSLPTKTYIKQLIEINGPDHALRLMEKSLESTKRGSSVVFYDECEWSYNENGHFVESKNQTKNKAKKQAKRVKGNLIFYTEAIRLIKKELQSANS